MAADTKASDGASEEAPSKDPEQIEAEIEATREELSKTVNELSQKLDVKAQTQQRVDEIKHRAQTTMQDPQARSEALKAAAPVLAGIAGVAILLGVLRRAFR